MFSKKDIKPGMLVEMSVHGKKKLRYVTLCKEGMVLVDKEGYHGNLKYFNDDLSSSLSPKIKITTDY